MNNVDKCYNCRYFKRSCNSYKGFCSYVISCQVLVNGSDIACRGFMKPMKLLRTKTCLKP